MSKLGLIMGMAGLMAAAAESQERFYLGEKGVQSVRIKDPEPAWKRKKCKSCRSCGYNCYPNNVYKCSKPQNRACEKWSQK
jgi:hypothetical protein